MASERGRRRKRWRQSFASLVAFFFVFFFNGALPVKALSFSVSLAAKGDTECPPGQSRVRDANQCLDAAKILDKGFTAAYEVASFPKGCFKAQDAVWYNTHPHGAAQEDAEVVCVRESVDDDGDATCSADGDCKNPKSTRKSLECAQSGFDSSILGCATCHMLDKRFAEGSADGKSLIAQCNACCRNEIAAEQFEMATLIADASMQERDSDLHDFIKRKAPKFPGLEVEYLEGATPAVEFENPKDQPGRVVRADVSGWKSEHLWDFFQQRLAQNDASEKKDGSEGTVAQGAFTAEIQSCSGWRLNQLPEVRRFIKEPGNADTYAGLKVNFIPHHNPDLVFFDEHGKDVERLDLGPYTTSEIHALMQKKGFRKKRAKIYKGEIRTCPGWRLNQLPDVRKFVMGKGHADSYAGLRINFIPHHSPVLVTYDERGDDGDEIDIADYSFDGLHTLLQSNGFSRKEML